MNAFAWLRKLMGFLQDFQDLVISLGALILFFVSISAFPRPEITVAISIIGCMTIIFVAQKVTLLLWNKIIEPSKILPPSGVAPPRRARGRWQSRLAVPFVAPAGYMRSRSRRRQLGAGIGASVALALAGTGYFVARAVPASQQILYGECVFTGGVPQLIIFVHADLDLVFRDLVYQFRESGIADEMKLCKSPYQVDQNKFFAERPEVDLLITGSTGTTQLVTPQPGDSWLSKNAFATASSAEIVLALELILAEKYYRDLVTSRDADVSARLLDQVSNTLDLALRDFRSDPRRVDESLREDIAKAYFLLAKASVSKGLPFDRIDSYLDIAIDNDPELWEAYADKIQIYFREASTSTEPEEILNEIWRIIAYLQANAPPRERASASLTGAELHIAAYGCDDWEVIQEYFAASEREAPYLDQTQLADSYITKGNICFLCERFSEAAAYFQHAIDEDSENPFSIHGLGKTLLVIKRFDEARQLYSDLKSVSALGASREGIIEELHALAESASDGEVAAVMLEIADMLDD